MRFNRSIGVAVVLGLLLGLLTSWSSTGSGQAQQEKPPVTWEYKTLAPPAANPEEALNQLGQQGWELAAITTFSNQPLYIFKRAKR
jgi:uncharacterized membrane protein YagU involved in acid resistance